MIILIIMIIVIIMLIIINLIIKIMIILIILIIMIILIFFPGEADEAKGEEKGDSGCRARGAAEVRWWCFHNSR